MTPHPITPVAAFKSVLERIAAMTVIEGGGTYEEIADEALEALANIRGLARELAANDWPFLRAEVAK